MKLSFVPAWLGLLAACTVAGTEADPAPAGAATPAALPAGPYRSQQAADTGPTYLYELRGALVDPRMGTTPTVDPRRGRALMFGGWSSGSVRSDTLEWDGIGWQRRISSGQPGNRFFPSSVYDTRFGRTLLFGGFGTTSPNLGLADDALWEWNGTDWARVPAESPPPARGGANLAQNPISHEIWMFGGSVQAGGTLATSDDLFRFDGTRWTRIDKPVDAPWPAPRALAAMSYDPSTGTIMLFGGFGLFNTNETGYPSIGEPYTDTWTWDGTSWTQQPTAAQPTGGVIALSSGAPVPLAGKQTLLHSERLGGTILVHEALGGIELWRYDAATPTWQPLAIPVKNGAGPNFRLLSSVFLDPVSNDIVITGGLATGVPLGLTPVELVALFAEDETDAYFAGAMSNEQWSFDGATWRVRTPPGDPGPRVETSAAYDESRGLAVMYGGRFGSSTTLDDTWLWNGGHWTESPGTAPPARREHAMAYDPVRKAVVLFGGLDENDQPLGDTWVWSGSWSALSPASSPSPRRGHQLMRIDAGVILHGGLLADGTLARDTWFLRPDTGSWEAIANIVGSSSHQACSASAASLGPYLFGGVRSADGTGTDDFTHFDQASRLWSGVDTPDQSANLGERRQCMLFADRSRGQLLIGGGLGGGVDENWNRFDLASGGWSGLQVQTYDRLLDPPRRVAAAAYFFDARIGVPTYYGGRAAGVDTTTSETWRVRQIGDACGADGSCQNGTHCVEGVCCESTACGPCESCAMPGTRGLCAPLGKVEPSAGCAAEQGLACSADGRCRGGDGAACSADPQCASGTCIGGSCCSAEGCVQRCVDENTQRNPNGSQTDCGAYACRGSACLTTCSTPNDCSPGTVCTAARQCVAVGSGTGQEPGGCSVGGRAAASWWTALIAALLLRPRNRRRSL